MVLVSGVSALAVSVPTTHHGQVCRTFDNVRDAGCEKWSLACRTFVEDSTATAPQATDAPFSDAPADDDCRAILARSQPSMVCCSSCQPMPTMGKVGLFSLGCNDGEQTTTPCVLGMWVFVGYWRRLGCLSSLMHRQARPMCAAKGEEGGIVLHTI